MTGSERTKRWRGYTLRELETRRLVTKIKIDFTKERVRMMYVPTGQLKAEASTFSRIADMSRSAVSVFFAVKKIMAIARSFKK